MSVDDDHMPLKRVMIDWGDNDDIFIENGLFKNNKPYCASQDEFNYAEEGLGRCWGTQITCTKNADCNFLTPLVIGDSLSGPPPCSFLSDDPENPMEWLVRERNFGDAPRACTPGYKEYFKSLSCDLASANFDIDLGSLPGVGALTNEMKEEIYALNPDAEKVCVFKPKVQVLDNWGWCSGGCDYNYDGVKEEGCYSAPDEDSCDGEEYDEPGEFYYPWVDYSGNIIIVPGDE